MKQEDSHNDLLASALAGDKASQGKLALLAQGRLHEFVYRLTLREDLTRDIVQESLVEMVTLFRKPKPIDRFWHWLYAVAYNKTCRHYQDRQRHKAVSLSEIDDGTMADPKAMPVAEAVEKELRRTVIECMEALEPRHRAILTMRCYDGIAYAEIAGMMGCSEFAARTLFCRAKRALAKRLAVCGLAKAGLITALIVFGKVTASSPASAAQVSVSAATLGAGTAASLAAALMTKTVWMGLAGSLAAAVTCASVMGVLPGQGHGPGRPDSATQGPAYVGTLSQQAGALYFFPEGPEGPMMMRTRAAIDHAQPWAVLQTDQANFFCDGTRVEVRNQRAFAPDLSQWPLPVPDSVPETGLGVRDRGSAILMIVSDDVKAGASRVRVVRHPNALQEDYFQPDQAAGLTWSDKRDAMHKRGWAYVKVHGHVQGRPVSGTGLVPFVYAAYRQHRPWLQIETPDGARLIDLGESACMQTRAGTVRLSGGDVLKGLSRPWMGLHTIDLIRREAGRCHLQFSAALDRQPGKALLQVVQDRTTLSYTIDLESDLVEQVELCQDGQKVGELRLQYLQDSSEAADPLRPPAFPACTDRARTPLSGPLWVIQLANGSLASAAQ